MENITLNLTEFINHVPGGKQALWEPYTRYHFMTGPIATVPWPSQNIVQQEL